MILETLLVAAQAAPVLLTPARVAPAAPAAPAAHVPPAAATSFAPPPREGPWRLGAALGAPPWLELSLEQRTRYEAYDDEIRAARTGSNSVVALRTLLSATARVDSWRLDLELIDARQHGEASSFSLDTSMVDAADVLQAYVGYRGEDVFREGDALDVRVGRQTMDLGNRRLVARNAYRNTINAFTGARATWEAGEGASFGAFAFVPVQRLPRAQAELEDNEVDFDEEEDGNVLLGLHGAAALADDVSLEAYALRLSEDDTTDVPTRDRRLWTVGARALREPAVERLHFEWESAYQLGDSRTSTGSTTDLDHEAHFHHLSAGWTFAGQTKPRVEALFDYASGDSNPADGDNGRFDTLFGARRFELGPTGVFGAFARSNLLSPGYRLTVAPTSSTQIAFTHRLHYLASDKDAWTTTGLVDPTGGSGRYIGQLAEIAARWDVLPKNLRLEVGLAQLFEGGFAENAPNANADGDTTYVYLSWTLRL